MKFKLLKRIFVFLVFAIITSVLIFITDQVESNTYYTMDNYQMEKITISNTGNTNYENLERLLDFAEKNEVIFSKEITSYSEHRELSRVFYFSSNTIEPVLKKLNINYTTENNDINSNSYASTKHSNDKLNAWKINDLLNNSSVEIRNFDEYISSQKYMFTEYRVYYKNIEDFNTFISEGQTIFDNNIVVFDESGYYAGTDSSFYILPIVIFSIFILFYLVVEIFTIYNSARKIGIMKLMGFTISKVYKNIIKRDCSFYTITSLILLLLLYIFLPGMYIGLLCNLALLYVVIIIIFLSLSFLSLWIIFYKKDIVSILKNISLIKTLLKVSFIYKIISICLFIFILMNMFSEASVYYSKISAVNNLGKLSNYAYFAYINEDTGQNQSINHSNLNQLYAVLGDSNIDHFYSDFTQYMITDEESIKMTNDAIKNSQSFPFATVDYNYLKLNNIQIYDANARKIDIKKKNEEYFIFPKEYTKYYDAFIKMYKSRIDSYNMNILYDTTLYTYENMEINQTFLNDEGTTTFSSKLILSKPIIRVTYDAYPLNYIDDMYGLNLIGIGENTGLRFNTHGDKKAIYEQLKPILQKYNLDEVYAYHNFVTTGELMGEQLVRYRNSLVVEGVIILMLLFISLVITIGFNSLLIEKKKKEISIKLLLGYNRVKIFKRMYLYNILSILIPIGTAFIYTILSNGSISLEYILVISGLFLLESSLFLMSIKKMNLNGVISCLKGDK